MGSIVGSNKSIRQEFDPKDEVILWVQPVRGR
jgi:hypothetical protein